MSASTTDAGVRRFPALLAGVVLATAAGCGGPPAALDTGGFLVDPGLTLPDALWERDLGRAIEFPPISVPGGWLAVATEGSVWRMDRESGAERWKRNLPSSPTQEPALCGTVVVVPTDLPKPGLVALEVADGKEKWKVETRSALIAGRDTLLVAVERGGDVSRIDPASGEVRWRTDLPGAGWRRPALRAEAGVVLVPVRPDSVVALDLGTGERRWTTQVGPWPRVSEGTGPVVVVGDDSTLVVLNSATGAPGDVVRLESMSAGPAAAANGLVYVALRNGTVAALEEETLAERWRRELDPPLVSPPLALDTWLVQAGSGGIVYVFQAATGEPIAVFPHPELLIARPAGDESTLAVPGHKGKLAVYRRSR